jgi:2-oxoglutarate ferredoxin oxidoreductase subunit alpha
MKLVERLWNKVEKNANRIGELEIKHNEDSDLIVLSYGSPSRPALKAVIDARKEQLKVGYVRLKTLWPFPDAKVSRALEGAKCVVVPEMNMGKIVREVQRVVQDKLNVVSFPKPGIELHKAKEILNKIRSVYG